MEFTGFEEKDFSIFEINGLNERMEKIRERIQPKFQKAGNELTRYLSEELNEEMFLHIAQHARRSVNPPNDTWFAIASNKRGYKKHPHFQVGLFDDHVFVWFALIYELPNKSGIASEMLRQKNEIKNLPDDFVVSLDHTKKEAFSVQNLEDNHLIRFRDVKKAELLIGKQYTDQDPIIKDGPAFLKEIKETYGHLLPFYRAAMASR